MTPTATPRRAACSGVLAHPAQTDPTQQGQGYFARALCCTTGQTLQLFGILLLVWYYYYYFFYFAFPFRLAGYLLVLLGCILLLGLFYHHHLSFSFSLGL